MAIARILLVSVLALALVRADDELYTSQVVKGSVNCLDCPRGSDLSGSVVTLIRVFYFYMFHEGLFFLS